MRLCTWLCAAWRVVWTSHRERSLVSLSRRMTTLTRLCLASNDICSLRELSKRSLLSMTKNKSVTTTTVLWRLIRYNKLYQPQPSLGIFYHPYLNFIILFPSHKNFPIPCLQSMLIIIPYCCSVIALHCLQLHTAMIARHVDVMCLVAFSLGNKMHDSECSCVVRSITSIYW